jgi:hypothetical protein
MYSTTNFLLTMQEPRVEAAAVQLPPGSTAADTAFYKDGQLALLLMLAQCGSGASNSDVILALLPLSELSFIAVPAEQQAAGVLQVISMQGPTGLCSQAGVMASTHLLDCSEGSILHQHVKGRNAVLAGLPRQRDSGQLGGCRLPPAKHTAR